MQEKRTMRGTVAMRSMFFLLAGLGAAFSVAGPALHAGASGAHRPSRQELIGAWRLSSIVLAGRDGILPDPFYQPGSIGLIIYDAAGDMSVQIAGPHRPVSALPSSRVLPASGREAVAKAAAFDSYYAYFGRWTYDAAKSAVIHHVESSLLPAEIGADYSQEVAIDGDRLIFTNRDSNHGNPTTRTKVWERVSGTAQRQGEEQDPAGP